MLRREIDRLKAEIQMLKAELHRSGGDRDMRDIRDLRDMRDMYHRCDGGEDHLRRPGPDAPEWGL